LTAYGRPRYQGLPPTAGSQLIGVTPNLSNPPPILAGKDYAAPSVFEPANLLREARRQKNVPGSAVPEICLLDPDGDIVRVLTKSGRGRRFAGWACYHTNLYEFAHGGEHFGIIGCAVGASFAVLLAEQLFASGCRLLISMTSAGQIVEQGAPPYFILIDGALRDEGTSYHYLPPAEFAEADEVLVETAMKAFAAARQPMHRGASWTTDAPFRETAAAIERCRTRNILAVEMEAAGLYAFAKARRKPVLCFAQVTNQMAVIEGDFEKGEADGSSASLAVIATAARAWRGLESRAVHSPSRAKSP
jgi:uridine phosphorylase